MKSQLMSFETLAGFWCPYEPSANAAGTLHGEEIGGVVVVDGGGDGDDVEFRLPQSRRIVGKLNGGIFDDLVAHLVGGIDAALVEVDLGGVVVVANDIDFPGKGHGDGHTNIAQTHQGDLLLTIYNFLIQIHILSPAFWRKIGGNCSFYIYMIIP